MILPALILQKPSKRSKAKDHKQCVTRRMQLWKEGNICEIMREVRYIQRKITTSKKQCTAEDISKTFAKLMMQGKVSVALKYLDNESSSVMTCTDSVLKKLREKHPSKEGSLLFGPINLIQDVSLMKLMKLAYLTLLYEQTVLPEPLGWTLNCTREFCAQNVLVLRANLREKK